MASDPAPIPRDPADPRNGGAPIRYESVFSGYRMFTDEKVVSWRATNELVQKLGGWSVFARDNVPGISPVTSPAEAQAVKNSGPATEPSKKPESRDHAGHR